jgi:hypothetical protein
LYGFDIIISPDEEYSALIIQTSSEAPISLMDQIADELSIRQVKGKILLDLLLHSGNGDERFLMAFFDGNKFDMNTLGFIKIGRNNESRKLTSDYFRRNPQVAEYSILNNFQKKLIFKGCYI